MRISHTLSVLSLTLLATTLGVSVSALPSAPPPGGYTGGVFAYYFKNIVEGSGAITNTTLNGDCQTGKVITGFSTVAGLYGLPKCGTIPQYWSSTDAGVNIYFTGAGNVGIGTATPGARLDVVGGDARVNGVTVGRGGGNVLENTTNGYQALYANTAGSFNTANGYRSLYSNIGGYNNTAIGQQALRDNTSGYWNVAIGAGVLVANTVGYYNTANGVNAMFYNINGHNNTANGANALFSNTTGIYNTANGVQGLAFNTIGSYNTANGLMSLNSNISGNSNTALGYSAGSNLTSGDNNIALGASTNFPSTTASNQLNIGNWIYGSGGNIGIGTTTPGYKLDVNGNVRINGGSNYTLPITSSYDLALDTSNTNRRFIFGGNGGGYSLQSTELSTSNVLNMSLNPLGGNIGIGTTNPTAKLEVNGQIKITGGVPGVGKVLTSDATGLASWVTPSAGAIAGGQTNYIARWITATTLGTGSVFDNGTNVGIGTVAPAGKLDVAGKIVAGVATTDYLPTGSSWNYNLQLNGLDTTSIGFHDASNNVGSIRFRNNLFTIGADDGWGLANTYFPGNVGIGTTTPTAKLAVNAIGVIGLANNAAYDIGAGRIAVGQSLYSYGRICAGAASGDCTGGGGFLADNAGNVTANGIATVGTTSSNLFMNDSDESTTGPKRLHANSNLMGFINGAGSWMSYWDNAGNQTNAGYIQAPIFYDSNNTGYYADPASISQFNRIDFDHMYDRNNYAYYIDPNNASVFNVIYAAQFLYNSDIHLKQNIKPLDNSLSRILSLNGYAFDWKKDNKHDIGVIAQEVEKVFPTIVHTDEKTGMKSVQYGNLVAPIIEAIKELNTNIGNNTTEIDALRSENAILKKRLDAIEARLAK